jgi:hypothetical protein
MPTSSFSSLARKQVFNMQSHVALIERSNRKDLRQVEIHLTVTEPSVGRQSWGGNFTSRTTDGILPNERLTFTLDNGQRGMARVNETAFDSRMPDATVIHFKGTGPLV